MSVFKVKLQNVPQQGYLDINPTTGLPFVTSIQRTMYCVGPNLTYRKLNDGDTFTDCNYWKRFDVATNPTYGFIQVISDDGSVYSDDPAENTFPRTYMNYAVNTTDTFATNFIDIIGTLGGPTQFLEITNLGTVANQDITVQLNGSANAAFTLAHGVSQIFNASDIAVTKLAFQGGVANTTLQIIMSVFVQCNS